MITENNYSLQLYNGDSGVILRDSEGQLAAWFEGADGAPRRFAISRLPAHDCSYAISVHKSQGSEYRHVALVLPPSDPRELTPLISRELIYTAVTRAREKLTLACTAEVLCAGIRRRVCRETGLVGRLGEFD
jgi:exodeoxyribonuclease V alpha subunit